jgi:hypothetical protein
VAMRLSYGTRQDSPPFEKLSINFVDQCLNIRIMSFNSFGEKKCPKDKKVLGGFFGQHE